ncbi:MAG: IclR family transcriptional regulator, partial [Chromatiales bacterium]|nr:IclR family transcriptional regulator [Chromatiales bacterium]
MEHSASTVEKALDLLFHLHDGNEPQGVSAISRQMGIPKSSAHRLLAALNRKGMVERDSRGRYQPGAGLVALGLGVLDRDPLVTCSRAALRAAVTDVGETFFVVAERNANLCVLDKCEGPGLLRAAPHIGSTVPVHCTAVGRLYLAHCPEQFTCGDIAEAADVDVQHLTERVGIAKARGWDSNIEEWQSGLSVIAAPILVRGTLRGAVALGASSSRLTALGGTRLHVKVVET